MRRREAVDDRVQVVLVLYCAILGWSKCAVHLTTAPPCSNLRSTAHCHYIPRYVITCKPIPYTVHADGYPGGPPTERGLVI
jgi:hypothetical protein